MERGDISVAEYNSSTRESSRTPWNLEPMFSAGSKRWLTDVWISVKSVNSAESARANYCCRYISRMDSSSCNHANSPPRTREDFADTVCIRSVTHQTILHASCGGNCRDHIGCPTCRGELSISSHAPAGRVSPLSVCLAHRVTPMRTRHTPLLTTNKEAFRNLLEPLSPPKQPCV